jgi:antitoxin PrlF
VLVDVVMMGEVKVTRKYQITIPKEIRVKLGVKIGDKLILEEKRNGIFIQVAEKISDPSQFLWSLTKKPIDVDAVKLVEESWGET